MEPNWCTRPTWVLTQMETPYYSHQGGSLSAWVRTAVRTLGQLLGPHRLYSMGQRMERSQNSARANQLLNPIQADTMYIGESRLNVRLEEREEYS